MESVFDPGRLLVISPHLDDAALGCALLIAAADETAVATVFSAAPGPGAVLTDWDRGCGFADGMAAMAARHGEDAQAMRILGARAHYLGFHDSQYAPLPSRARLVRALSALVSATSPDTVCVPLGLFHCDHECVHEACMAVMLEGMPVQWVAYEDVLYRRRHGVLQRRLGRLGRRGIIATPVVCHRPVDASVKARAVAAYASQLSALGLSQGGGDAAALERYWWLDGLDAAGRRNGKTAPAMPAPQWASAKRPV